MCYQNSIQWTLEHHTLPKLIKSCSKCGQDATYVNSEKFRVNANNKNLDIWMIFSCEKCKTTYNLTLFERVSPKVLPPKQLEAYMNNDLDAIINTSFDFDLYQNNKVAFVLNEASLHISGDLPTGQDPTSVTLVSDRHTGLRLDRVLAHKLKVSRSSINKAFHEGNLILLDEDVSLKTKIKNSLTFVIKKPDALIHPD